MLRKVFLILFLSLSVFGFSQSDSFKRAFEFGVMGGGSYYIGDINNYKHYDYQLL